MPSRTSPPRLSLFPRQNSSSSAPSSKMPAPPPIPASPSQRASASASTSSPRSPPARLHLRNILPASPEEPPIMPPPPRTPRAWVWQCHKCLVVYRLGCTRRCLYCSHTYCVETPRKSGRGRKRRRPTGVCAAEFDYVGWEQWGSWKRKVLGYESQGRCEGAARDRAFLAKRHDCWIDCDSPSECCHRRHALAAEMLRKGLFAPEPEPMSGIVPGSPPGPDDDISLTEALELSHQVDEEEEPQKSPLQSSFLLDEDEDDSEKTREQERKEEEIWWAAQSGSSEHDVTGSRELAGGDERDELGEGEGGVLRKLTVRNLADDDASQDSDSSSGTDESMWSSSSSASDSSAGDPAGLSKVD